SRSGITPFVGELPGRPALQPNPDEVELAFDIALADLLADGVYREELWQRADLPGGQRSIHFFDLPEDIIWGATARILRELLDLVIEGDPSAGSADSAGEDGDQGRGDDQRG